MSMTEIDNEVNDANVTSTRGLLEREKLALEIEQLKQPWWRKPTYILAALPTILAIASVIYGFANGYFQAAAIKLENQKHDLEVQIEEFTETKGKLERENLVLREQLEDITKFIAEQKREEKEIREEIQTLKQSAAAFVKSSVYWKALEKENEQLKKEIQRLKNRK